ncbi:hypothetical protein [Paenibacillus riograndensis]|uniref:Uncharacterized protein n=1 Tax=Paenibacillus riograndensis SBR5 TaxID=1073571 RepID=A0A0E3WHT1_9BACL|nr:hypothetical protein [Paenibacillus riograndensis]CQR55828.1 hypothetical protein PRIO_3425 [Paenibacillus riograndensis SBR5]
MRGNNGELTYSLTGEDGGAGQYYRDVALFTNEVLMKLHEDPSIAKFGRYIALREPEAWNPDIYALECLPAGFFHRCTGIEAGAAGRTEPWT